MSVAKPKTERMWGLYNYGILLSVHFKRAQAIAQAEEVTLRPWSKCRKYCQVKRVTVTPESP